MEVMPHNPATGPQRALIRLKVGDGLWPLSVELTVDPHVYLHAAELIQSLDVHGRMLGLAYKDECSAVWRQVEPLAADGRTEFAVSWLAIANASPHAEYKALLTVRDARGRLVEAWPGSQNPTATPGLIGPEQNPTDIGGLLVQVLSTDVAAASVVPLFKEPTMAQPPKSPAAGGVTPKHVEPPPEALVATSQPKHVEPPPGAFFAASQKRVRVTITRNPATTRVIIDGVRVEDDETWTDLNPGRHNLQIGVAGKAGDQGAGSLHRGETQIAAAAVEIPEGEIEAYSAEVPFNV